ncbi:MAG: hypothetical protein KDC24_07690, partial [Saprospiraceae bacterium]|nr:hypothetical protein [Saprospiraceae bacterium]
MMRYLILSIVTFFILGACGEGAHSSKKDNKGQSQTEPEISEYNKTKRSQLPPISKEWFERLLNEVDYVDFIFYN